MNVTNERKNVMPFEARYSATFRETSEGTGYSRSRVYEIVKKKNVKTMRNGRRRLIVVSSFLAAIQ